MNKERRRVMTSEELDVIQRVLELIETGNEAIDYVQNKVLEGNYEAAYSVFVDIVELFVAVEAVIRSMQPELKPGDIGNDLSAVFNRIVTCYEDKNYSNLSSLVVGMLIPSYGKWYKSIQKKVKEFVEV